MQTFTRLFSIITFLLSLGFIAQALPTQARGAALAVRQYEAPATYGGSDPSYGSPSYGNDNNNNKNGMPALDVRGVMVALDTNLAPHINTLAAATDIAAAQVSAMAIVTEIKSVVAKVQGVIVAVDASVVVEIAQIYVNIVIAIVSALASLVGKLGLTVCISLIAQIEVCMHLLLLTLNVCISGFLKACIKLCVNLDAKVLLDMKSCNLQLLIAILRLVIN
ncbi:transmembrane protein [Ceratobasidium sp. AG-Ba]|nr:transmembrane protein [Ceratobasidium sp. AG-Ba]